MRYPVMNLGRPHPRLGQAAAPVPAKTCPPGSPDLVCEIYDFQNFVREMQSHGQSADAIRFQLYAVQAPAKPRDSLLAKNWYFLSWAVQDLEIPPEDWPALVKNFDQTWEIFQNIPWPGGSGVGKGQKITPIGALFKNCASGLPIYNGMTIGNYRLYSNRFTGNYFPRGDAELRADMAASYLLNIGAIFECMIAREIAAAQRMKKHLGRLALLRLGAAFIFAPLAAGAMPGVLVAETGTFAASQAGGSGTSVIAGAARGASKADVAAIGAGLFAAGIALLLPELTKNSDPAVQSVANAFGPRLAEAAAKDILNEVIPQGAVSGPALTTAQGLGTAGAALAVEVLLSLITLKGVRDAKSFAKEVTRVSDFVENCATPDEEGRVCAELVPFVTWCIEAMYLSKFLDIVAERAGIGGVDVGKQDIVPAADRAESQGVEVPSSAVSAGGVAPGISPVLLVGGGAAVGATALAFILGAFR
jgi:hypothetical protein